MGDRTDNKPGVLVLFILNARLATPIEFDPLIGYKFEAETVDAVSAGGGPETRQDLGR